MKVIIIGAVAGGATAAARLRRLDEQAEITVFERTGYISYATCGLPYYLGGVIQDPGELTVQTPESFRRRYRINVFVHHEVTAIHPERRTVTVLDLEKGTSREESYDKLLLSPGARPVRPDLPGVELHHIYTLRTVEDVFQIRGFLEQEKPQSAVIVGGGFVGLEAAENLSLRGIKVTLVELTGQVMGTLDYDIAVQIHQKLRQKGIDLRLRSQVSGFSQQEAGIRVEIQDQPSVTADLVLLAIGVKPETTLAKNAGLKLGIKDSILVDDQMRTSDPDIFAVGDAVQVRQRVSGKDTLIPLAGPANKQGRIAADVICGRDSHYKGSLGSSVVKLFDMTIASTGLSEKAAKAAGIEYDSVMLFPASHAGYYPGASALTMKVVFEKQTGRILGAQILGSEGADKRLDVLAAAIGAGMTAEDLKDLDLSYAPPYSSAKDPVNMAGFMIENVTSGLVKQFHWNEVETLSRDGSVTLLDVRTPREYQAGHAEGFRNIPVDELREHLTELDPSKSVYVMCQSGLRSYVACRILSQKGFDCYNLSGGYRFYSSILRELKA